MKGLARKLEPENEEYWGMVGLLHDLDEEHCNWQEHPEVHGKTAVEMLKKEGIEDQVLFDAICAHNPFIIASTAKECFKYFSPFIYFFNIS